MGDLGSMMNLGMQVYNIQQFLVNNGFDPKQIDVAAYIDPTLSLTENKKEFARKLGIPINQIGGKVKPVAGKNYNRAAKKQVDEQYCNFLSENCEIKCNNSACKVFKKEGCQGEITPCKPSRYTKTARKKSVPASGGNCNVVAYKVEAHTRPPQHNSRTGKQIVVKGYTVMQHPRLCRRSGYG
jgi:hypothetical protein